MRLQALWEIREDGGDEKGGGEGGCGRGGGGGGGTLPARREQR